MQPRSHPVRGSGREDAAALIGGEDAALAEDVAVARPTLRRDARQLLLDEMADIDLGRITSVAELGRHGVRAEVRRHDIDGALLAEVVGDLHEAELGLEVEAVARR